MLHGFVYDGVGYTTFDHPLGVNGTVLYGIDGNKLVGTYGDASKVSHGFLFDGTTYTTIDFPGAKITRPFGVSGSLVVGSYEDSKNRTHGFVYNGSTYATLDDPLFPTAGTTVLQGIDGSKIVGNTQTGFVAAAAFLYDGTSFSHPFGIEALFGGNDHHFNDISGNRIVGEYDDRPFVYIVPEPSTLVLATLGATGIALFWGVAHA